MHEKAKIQVKNDKLKENNNFSENETFTGRTIKFILNEISNLTKNKMIDNKNITDIYLSEVIKSTFEHYYFNSFNIANNLNNYKLFRKNIVNSFLESIKINIEIGDDDLNILYNDIFEFSHTDKFNFIKLLLFTLEYTSYSTFGIFMPS